MLAAKETPLWRGVGPGPAAGRRGPLSLPHGVPPAGGTDAHLPQRLAAGLERQRADLQGSVCLNVPGSENSPQNQLTDLFSFSSLWRNREECHHRESTVTFTPPRTQHHPGPLLLLVPGGPQRPEAAPAPGEADPRTDREVGAPSGPISPLGPS